MGAHQPGRSLSSWDFTLAIWDGKGSQEARAECEEGLVIFSYSLTVAGVGGQPLPQAPHLLAGCVGGTLSFTSLSSYCHCHQ
jgi:hypothetical protein